MKFYMKVYKNYGMVSVCDQDIMGKKIEWGGVRINISKEFYGEKLFDLDFVIKRLMDSKIANLIGNKIVEGAIGAKIINKENVLDLNGVLHAQLVRL